MKVCMVSRDKKKNVKITTKKAKQIKSLYSTGKYTWKELAEKYNVHYETIRKFKNGIPKPQPVTKKHRKLLRTIKRRKTIEAVLILGGKCMSCGEPYNYDPKSSNLHFDHKYYTAEERKIRTIDNFSRNRPWQVLKDRDRFNLLCNPCHQIISYGRLYPKKLKNAVNFLRK